MSKLVPGDLVALYNDQTRRLITVCNTCWSWTIKRPGGAPGNTLSMVKDWTQPLTIYEIFRVVSLGGDLIGFELACFPGYLLMPFDGSSVQYGYYDGWGATANTTARKNIQYFKPIVGNALLADRPSVAAFRLVPREGSTGFFLQSVAFGQFLSVDSNLPLLVQGSVPVLKDLCTTYCYDTLQVWQFLRVDASKCCMGQTTALSNQSICGDMWNNKSVCDALMTDFCHVNPLDPVCSCLNSPITEFNPLCVDGSCVRTGYTTANMLALPCPNIISCNAQILLGSAGRDVLISQNQFVQQCGAPTDASASGAAASSPASTPQTAPYVAQVPPDVVTTALAPVVSGSGSSGGGAVSTGTISSLPVQNTLLPAGGLIVPPPPPPPLALPDPTHDSTTSEPQQSVIGPAPDLHPVTSVPLPPPVSPSVQPAPKQQSNVMFWLFVLFLVVVLGVACLALWPMIMAAFTGGAAEDTPEAVTWDEVVGSGDASDEVPEYATFF